MPANKARGEVDLTLGGDTYTIRPSFDRIANIEGQVGGILPFLERLQTNRWTVTELVTVVQCMMRGQSDGPKPKEVPDLMLQAEDGVISFVGPVAEFLTNCVTGGRKEPKDEGNGKVAA